MANARSGRVGWRLFGVLIAGLALGTVLLSAAAQDLPKDKAKKEDPKTAKKEDKKPTKKDDKKDPKTADQTLEINGALTPSDPSDRLRSGCHAKVHLYQMVVGKRYLIDLIDKNAATMDPYLRLEDSKGKQLAEDDDGGPRMQDARIVFSPPKSDTYRIIVTTCDQARTGNYLLQARPLLPGEAEPKVKPTPGGLPSPVKGPPPAPGGTVFSPPATSLPIAFGEVSIKPVPRPHNPYFGSSNDDTRGYLEHRFLVENKSKTDSHQVTLTLPRYRGYGQNGYFLRSTTRTVKIEPQETMPVSLFQPELPFFNSSDVEVAVDGKVQPQGLGINTPQNRGTKFSSMGSSGTSPAVHILASAELVAPLNQHVEKSAVREPPVFSRSGAVSSRGFMHGGKSYTYFMIHRFNASHQPLDAWSTHWLGYSSYDGIVLGGPKLQAAPADVKNTLWKYVEAGGSLLLLGKCEVPEGWSRRKAELNKMTAYYPGFGQCLVNAEEDITKWEPAQWIAITDMWDSTTQLWQGNVFTPTQANRHFEVVSNLGVPVRGLFSMMLLFTALIGPVNIYVLGRKRRRIWMLWTVPAFSLVTCVLLFGFMLLSEGWHGHVRAEGATFLDETSQRTASIGWMGFYSPMTPGDGLRFSDNTELTPHFRVDPLHYRRQRLGLSITWSDDVQHLDSGWLTARVPAHFLVRSVERRLERLIVTAEPDGSLSVLNSFKAPIQSLWLADKEGRIYTAENIAKGSRGVLKRVGDEKAGGRLESLRIAYQKDWSKLVDAVTTDAAALLNPAAVLTPGCYVAVVEGAPFFEDGLRSAQNRKGRSVVFGVMKEPI
jgi:hypothetical protein